MSINETEVNKNINILLRTLSRMMYDNPGMSWVCRGWIMGVSGLDYGGRRVAGEEEQLLL